MGTYGERWVTLAASPYPGRPDPGRGAAVLGQRLPRSLQGRIGRAEGEAVERPGGPVARAGRLGCGLSWHRVRPVGVVQPVSGRAVPAVAGCGRLARQRVTAATSSEVAGSR